MNIIWVTGSAELIGFESVRFFWDRNIASLKEETGDSEVENGSGCSVPTHSEVVINLALSSKLCLAASKMPTD